MKRFDFDEYINATHGQSEYSEVDTLEDFYELCAEVRDEFFLDWESRESSRSALELQKRAIIGYEKEKAFFKERILQIVSSRGRDGSSFPSWYPSLEDAIYHENWGLAGLAEWFTPAFSQSSSAKVIGGDIFFLEEGRMALKPQRIREDRKQQLIKAFLLLTPDARMDRDYYETYMLDGTRVTIFTEPMAKDGRSAIIFRRYVVPALSFEEQAQRGTIPAGAIPLFRSMVRIGFNVVFMGAVRTAKTTFLSTWQRYEDPALEGVMVETDPEIPMHELLPGAPILQLIADGEELRRISKNLMRSDADYFILAEARDGVALDTAVKIAAKGTKRMKLTFHSRQPENFPLEAAMEIVKATGGDLRLTMEMVAANFDYLFHFIQLSDKRQKRLKAIYQMSLGSARQIEIRPICEYDPSSESWSFYDDIGHAQSAYALESDPEAFEDMKKELKKLADNS
ncbi:MAG: Flp pilus assembly complex ATPase component TadA [Firmicutes bacterium]|nr:Flp pilus assembly complex ATPase component TadA [Bacillota bacterium]